MSKIGRQAFERDLLTLGAGIEACFEKKLITPALVLIYSAIDIVAWLANDKSTAKVGDRFRAWVNGYMLPASPLPCTADDLYGARCGLVHSFTAMSDLTKKNKARLVSYAWGKANAEKLQKEIDGKGWAKLNVAVHVEDIYRSWRLGLARLVEEMEQDAARANRIYKRAENFFHYIGHE